MTDPDPSDRATRSKSILLLALETPPELRAALLKRECGSDTELRREIEELLRYDTANSARPYLSSTDGTAQAELTGRLGAFSILRLLGRGGMGEVYLASEAPHGRLVALKVLRRVGTTNERRKRFEREARALARLEHPGIAAQLGRGTLETDDGPLPYLEMEYIEGRSLREVMETEPADVSGILAALAQVAETLEFAHRAGVVHRDLKPENIVIDRQGRPRLLDFGVARLNEEGAGPLTLETQVGQIIGTLQYMSPEQVSADGRGVDGRADIYSFGVIAYEWLSGRLPYGAGVESFHQAVVQILTAVPAMLGQVRSELAGGVERIVARCLAKRPENRYASARELADDIERHRNGQPVLPWDPVVEDLPPRADTGRFLGGRRIGSTISSLWFLGVVAAVLVLLGRTSFRPGSAAQDTSPSAAWRELFDAVATADKKLHKSGGTDSAIVAGIGILEQEARVLPGLPPRPYSSRLDMYIHWRLGEGHAFLASSRHDPAELDAARASWELSFEANKRPGGLDGLDTTVIILPEIQRLGRHHPLAGMAGVFSELADYRTPVKCLLDAAVTQTNALNMYEDPKTPNYDPAHPPLRLDQEVDLAILLNDMGAMWAEAGAALDSLELIDRGLSRLARSDSAWTYKGYHSPYGSFLHHYGRAYRLRGELSGLATDLDSADAWLARALEVRTPGEGPASYAATKSEQARVALARSRLSASRADRKTDLERGLSDLTAARQVLKSDGYVMERAWLDIDEAELLSEYSVLLRSSSGSAAASPHLLRADSLLRSGASVLTMERFPVQHSRMVATLGRVALSRWETLGDDAARRRGRDEIAVAIEQTPTADDPHLRRILEDLARRLGG